MFDQIMKTTFKAQEVAAALEHGNFSSFVRNLNSDKFCGMPKFSEASRNEYHYAQIAEMAIHLSLAQNFSRQQAFTISQGIFKALSRQVFNTAEFQKKYEYIKARFDELDRTNNVLEFMGDTFLAPQLILGETNISRDPKNRTWAMFLPVQARSDGPISIKLVNEGEIKLSEVRNLGLQLAIGNAADDRSRYAFEPYSYHPGMLDLTGVFLRFEDILSFRLKAKSLDSW